MRHDDKLITQQTLNWVQSFVIHYNICPFAKHVVDKNALPIQVTHAKKQKKIFEELLLSIQHLENNPDIDTLLLVIPKGLLLFFDYLDCIAAAEALMIERAYEGKYQLATFHPDYCFAGVDIDDVSNYTNRSPYPMIHILREASLEKALSYYPNAEAIPERNIATMRRLGLEELKNKVY